MLSITSEGRVVGVLIDGDAEVVSELTDGLGRCRRRSFGPDGTLFATERGASL